MDKIAQAKAKAAERRSKIAELKCSEMKRLNAKTAKKGDVIFLVGPWNFHWNMKRSEKYSEDVYAYHKWTIHSIGKKVLKLSDEEGLRKTASYSYDGNFLIPRMIIKGESIVYNFSFFAWEEKDIETVVDCMRMADQYARSNFRIEEHRY